MTMPERNGPESISSALDVLIEELREEKAVESIVISINTNLNPPVYTIRVLVPLYYGDEYTSQLLGNIGKIHAKLFKALKINGLFFGLRYVNTADRSPTDTRLALINMLNQDPEVSDYELVDFR